MTKGSTKYSSQAPKIQHTCEQVIEKIKTTNGGKFKLNFGTQVKSIFTRQGKCIVTRFNDTDQSQKEFDMKVLYHIDMESGEQIKFLLNDRIMGFSPVIN